MAYIAEQDRKSVYYVPEPGWPCLCLCGCLNRHHNIMLDHTQTECCNDCLAMMRINMGRHGEPMGV